MSDTEEKDEGLTPDLIRKLYPKTAERMLGASRDPGFEANIDSSTRDELIEKYLAQGKSQEYAEERSDHDLFLRNVYAKSLGRKPTGGN